MRFVIQVVENASVRVVEEADGTVPENGGYVSGSIGKGLMVLVGISGSDTKEIADKMVEKMRKLRILRMRTERPILIWQQWGRGPAGVPVHPVCGLQKGNRPSFVHAGLPDMAEPMFEYIADMQGSGHGGPNRCLRCFYEGLSGQ